MPRKVTVSMRRAWDDRYRAPTAERLVAGVEAGHRELVVLLRRELAGLPGVREQIGWEGIPWRWSLGYRAPGVARALAYLVPQPDRPLLVLPLPETVIEALTRAKISRPTRERILLSPAVGDARWTQWELSSKMQAEELLILARCSHETCTRPAHAKAV